MVERITSRRSTLRTLPALREEALPRPWAQRMCCGVHTESSADRSEMGKIDRSRRQRCTVESQGPSAVMTASGDVRLGAQGRWGDRLRGCTITGTRPPERMTRGLPQYDAIVSHDHSIEHVTTHSHIYRDINQILRPQTLPRGRIVLPSPFGENGFPLRVPLLYSGERGRSRPGARPLRTAVGDGSQPRDPARSP